MSNTDKYFEALAVRLQNDVSGLLALSEIMESHMRYSIDPRLSSDPLTALSALLEFHKMGIGRDYQEVIGDFTRVVIEDGDGGACKNIYVSDTQVIFCEELNDELEARLNEDQSNEN